MYDQLLIIDDGSTTIPDWTNTEIISNEQLPQESKAETVIFKFEDHLGRQAVDCYPGWYRSYMFAASYADRFGFDKIIHIESDAHLISDRIQTYVNDLSSGWTTFWCPRHSFPENAIQIIAGNSVTDFIKWNKKRIPYDNYKGVYAEYWTPFTNVNKEFNGDRWNEFDSSIPLDADFAAQLNC